jgi:hypothetical protein
MGAKTPVVFSYKAKHSLIMLAWHKQLKRRTNLFQVLVPFPTMGKGMAEQSWSIHSNHEAKQSAYRRLGQGTAFQGHFPHSPSDLLPPTRPQLMLFTTSPKLHQEINPLIRSKPSESNHSPTNKLATKPPMHEWWWILAIHTVTLFNSTFTLLGIYSTNLNFGRWKEINWTGN